MDKLASLRAFTTIVESGGFSETARRLGVSKALISKQVAQLEESIGVRLLHRTTRRVSPTSSGKAYYDQCKPLLDDLEALDESMQTGHQALKGEIRVSAPTTFAELHLSPVISSFVKQHPQVRVNLALTDRFVDLVEDRIDLAIRIGHLRESSLVARRIGEIRLLLCASPDYIETHGIPASPQALSDHACVIDSNNPHGNRWHLRSDRDVCTVTVNGHLTVNSARAASDLVIDGNGIGFLPSFVVLDPVKKGQLVNLLADYTSEAIGIYAVYLHRKHLSLKVRRLMDSLIQSFESKF